MVDDFQVDEKLPLSKFPIQDYSEDVIDKAVRAANLLNSLIENHKVKGQLPYKVYLPQLVS